MYCKSPPARVSYIGMLLCALAIVPGDTASGEAQPIDRVKAAFLYQFARFVDWPDRRFENPRTPIRVCILGNDELAQEFKTIVRGKTVGSRRVTIVDVRDMSEALECHIVFVDSTNATRVTSRANEFIEASVLTICDAHEFTEHDGVIRLYEDGTKLKIEINIDVANRSELKISSKLLSVATVVGD